MIRGTPFPWFQLLIIYLSATVPKHEQNVNKSYFAFDPGNNKYFINAEP